MRRWRRPSLSDRSSREVRFFISRASHSPRPRASRRPLSHTIFQGAHRGSGVPHHTHGDRDPDRRPGLLRPSNRGSMSMVQAPIPRPLREDKGVPGRLGPGVGLHARKDTTGTDPGNVTGFAEPYLEPVGLIDTFESGVDQLSVGFQNRVGSNESLRRIRMQQLNVRARCPQASVPLPVSLAERITSVLPERPNRGPFVKRPTRPLRRRTTCLEEKKRADCSRTQPIDTHGVHIQADARAWWLHPPTTPSTREPMSNPPRSLLAKTTRVFGR
jgi:hypothetical protein